MLSSIHSNFIIQFPYNLEKILFSLHNFVKFHFSQKIDDSQVKFLKDKLILVNNKDDKIGSINKLDAHKISKNNLFPHRAFSILLFDRNNRLLLQQRSQQKFTFPLLWTNTCCSHPLVGEKMTNSLQKRLNFELGIKAKRNIFHLIDKIIYKAPSNKIFEEFELDYLYLAKIMDKKFISDNIKYNKDEVNNIKFIYLDELIEDIKNNPNKYTPWFKIIIKYKEKDIRKFLEKGKRAVSFDGRIKSYINY